MNAPADVTADRSEAPEPSRRPRWAIHTALLTAGPLLIAALGESRGGDQPALSGDAAGALRISAVHLASFAVVFGLAWIASRATWDELKLRWRPGRWVVPLGLAYSVAIRLGVGAILVSGALALAMLGIVDPKTLAAKLFTNRPKVEALVDVASLRDDPLYFGLIVTVVSFGVGGLREELWRSGLLAGLRGLWPRVFTSRRGELGGVAIASLLFGLGHLSQGPLAAGFAALLGFMLGGILVLHDSIWPAVIAHGAFDATTFAILPFALDKIHDLQKMVTG